MNSEENLFQGLAESFEKISAENAELRESLEDVRMTLDMEDRGWTLISGIASGEHLEGLDLREVKEISERIRPHVIANGLTKRGVDLHSGYVWAKGMGIEGVERDRGKSGAPSAQVKFYENVVNKEALFSAIAHEELQKARYADGNVFIACDKGRKEVRRIPLKEITALVTNPDYADEVWMYRRTWTTKNASGEDQEKSEWYYTNRYPSDRRKQKTVTNGDKREPVNSEITIVDKKFNRLVGYPLGIPDAVAAMPWIAAYQEIMQYGRVVTESLAKILYKITNKSAQGAKNAGLKVSGATGFGNTASMVEGQDIQAISTAGKGYEFTAARPVAAMAATALNVSVVELLSDSSAAGSSYGAAQTLTPSTRNAMKLMQSEWVELYEEVFSVIGLKIDRIWFEKLDDIELYREAQALTLLSPTLHPAEYRGAALDLLDINGDADDLPDTLEASVQNAAGMNDTASAGVQQAAPDQGRSNGTGGGGSTAANDQRTDTIESVRREMLNQDFLDRFENLIERFEKANEK